MSVFIDKGDGSIAVIGVSGEFLMCVSESKAQEYIKQDQAYLIRKGRVRVLQATAELAKLGRVDPLGRGTAFDHVRYSHQRETPQNPARVWTFGHLASAEVFLRVLNDCTA